MQHRPNAKAHDDILAILYNNVDVIMCSCPHWTKGLLHYRLCCMEARPGSVLSC